MLKITFIIIGTIIGAGFASGREIYTFFGQYGNIGLATIAVTGIIISLIIYKVLNIINIDDANKIILPSAKKILNETSYEDGLTEARCELLELLRGL